MANRVLIRTQDAILHAVTAGDLVSPGETLLAAEFAEDHAEQFDVPAWVLGAAYTVGDIYTRDTRFWRCLQTHTALDANWAPGIAWALWAEFWPSGVIPVWRQPQGAHDAYPNGFKVLHTGHLWTSLVANNVWEPGATGSESLWRCEDCPPPALADWAVGVAYTGDNTAGAGNGDVVRYVPNGHKYRCLQTHTSIVTWTPPVVPALWIDLGLA